MSSSTGLLYSPEGLQTQLSTVEVLTAMWAGDDELSLPPESRAGIEALVEYLALPLNTLGDQQSLAIKAAVPAALDMTLSIDCHAGDFADEHENSTISAAALAQQRKARRMLLDVTLQLRKAHGTSEARETTRPRLRLRPVDWIKAADQDWICKAAGLLDTTSIDSAEEEDIDGASYVLDIVETISEAARELAHDLDAAVQARRTATSGAVAGAGATPTKLVYRSWSCLPSLSTKEKRQDLVDYAKQNKPPLTGFVLAGKPALVVLEYPMCLPSGSDEQHHREEQIGLAKKALLSYWSSIKTRSWADIQSSHKKVSETLVEACVERVFDDMQEMTARDEIGGKEALRGTYKHRNDWSFVETWLKTKNCTGRLKEALGADWN